ncbi:MAG: hypothetical protein WCA78_15575 [Rhizomicrobium sp.]
MPDDVTLARHASASIQPGPICGLVVATDAERRSYNNIRFTVDLGHLRAPPITMESVCRLLKPRLVEMLILWQ